MGRRQSFYPTRTRYKPKPVSEIIVQMKNTVSLAMDLAYYAFINNKKDLSEYVFELEREIDDLLYQLIMVGSLAVRDKEDAESIASILQVGYGFNLIMNAIADIAKLPLEHTIPERVIEAAFKKTEEIVVGLQIWNASKLAGRPIRYLEENDIFVDLIAIKRGKKWIINPSPETVIEVNDEIIVRGIKEQLVKLYTLNGETPLLDLKTYPEESEYNTIEKIIVDRIIEIKNRVELMLDMAYSAVITNDVELAKKVLDLETYFDWLYSDFESLVISILNEEKGVNKSEILTLIKWGVSIENIADGAAKIAENIVRGLPTHPVLQAAMKTGEEFYRVYTVSKNSPLKGIRIGELEKDYGVNVIIVERNGVYIDDIDENFEIMEGDVLIIRGFKEAEKDLVKFISKK